FTFNLGCGNFRSSTLLKLVNEGKLIAAALQFPLWCHAGGQVMVGLVRRRKAEATLFMEGLQ
uniref:lysozyme n=1 Tax=Pseudomonas sp. TaxID=306 RepID=UPI002610DAE7